MKIRFCIEYFTHGNESLHIVFEGGKSQPLHQGGNGLWSAICEVKPNATYHYEVRGSEGTVVRQEKHSRKIASATCSVTIYDRWWETPAEQPFYSSFFTEGALRRTKRERKQLRPTAGKILLEVDAPTLRPEERLAIVGGNSALGGWCTDKALAMNDAAAPVWRVLIPQECAGAEYKFIITDLEGNFKRFECGDNRLIPFTDSEITILSGLRLRTTDEKLWRGAGVAIPIFSLRSESSWGVGEFSDLKQMARWAKAVGMSIIQTLPINDTSASFSWRDSYPYNAISSFALHPLYLGAKAAAECCKAVVDKTIEEQIDALVEKYSTRGAALNKKSVVDYEKAIKLKMSFLKELYKLCSEQVIESKSYAKFFAESESWLTPYATYCTLRDKYSTTDFTQWAELATYNREEVERYIKKNYRKINFYCFIQYLLDAELSEVCRYAHSLGVALKGDIPIGVSPRSVDVWCAPELYNTSMSAGAPPDAFAADGQNWGFPTYNWAKMAEDGYKWWQRRLEKMARYFDAYRIDHILGFFRIWEVPRQAQSAILGHFYPSRPYTSEEIAACGLKLDLPTYAEADYSSTDALFVPYPEGGYTPRIEGYKTEAFKSLSESQQQQYIQLHEEFFYHRHNDFWRECALKRLPALMSTTKMLTCGEDLGMIPACVPEVMNQERILSLEIERMPKQMGVNFGDTSRYPYLSVAATSTHDMSNIRGWWQEDSALTQQYWSEVLGMEGEAEAVCSGATAHKIIKREMLSNSILAILPLQDWMAIDEKLRQKDPEGERINIPANPNHYWRYRMHLTLESLLGAKSFNDAVKQLTSLR